MVHDFSKMLVSDWIPHIVNDNVELMTGVQSTG